MIDIMNQLGYVAAIPGNHEFNYSMERFFDLINRAGFPYITANFCREDGTRLLAPLCGCRGSLRHESEI